MSDEQQEPRFNSFLGKKVEFTDLGADDGGCNYCCPLPDNHPAAPFVPTHVVIVAIDPSTGASLPPITVSADQLDVLGLLHQEPQAVQQLDDLARERLGKRN